jgi:hypothetical protein
MSRPIRDSTLAQRATSEALRVSDRIHNVLDIVGRGDLVGLRRLERDGLVARYTEGTMQLNPGTNRDMGTCLLGCIEPRQHFLERYGHAGVLEAVQILVRNGADTSARTGDSDRNALDLAARYGDPALVTFLLANGLAVNGRNNRGETALYEVQRMDVARVLVQNGADVRNRTEMGWTPMHEFSNFLQADYVQFMLDCGADIEAVDVDNETPLFTAVSFGKLAVAEVLLAHGANLNVVSDENGLDILGVATMPGPLNPCLQPIREEMRRRDEVIRVARGEAFAMGLHDRLGGGSRVRGLEENLVRMIQDLADMVL